MASRREILRKLDELEGPIRNRFLEAVREAVGATSIQEVARLIERGDLDAVLDEVALTPSALSDVTEAMRDAYKAGGQFEAPEARIRFDMRNVAAEQWLRQQSSTFVTRVTEQQRNSIRLTVETGTRLGQNPRQTALDIAGRIDRTGRRSGGIVGLTDNQAGYVARTREELLSGDPERMRNYLGRGRRDKRFDAIVRRAIEQGRPVARADVERIAGRYSDRLLQLRGETIARTEAMQGFHAARDQAWEQAIEEGAISRQNVTKVWRATGDSRTRDTHAALNGETATKDEAFVSPSGARLMHPGDTSLGAPADEIIDCRCYLEMRGDFIAEQVAREAA